MSDGRRLQATDYTRTPIRVLNTVLRAANSIGLARISLDKDSLLTAARKSTGLNEFGDESFFEALGRLVDATEAEADLNPIGRFMARTSILRLLKHRLYAHDLLTRKPPDAQLWIPDPFGVRELLHLRF